MGNVNMNDIARKAGVSIATVGRVIHDNGYVSPVSREKVEKAVEELGYVPNRMARTLKSRKSGIIGSLITHNQNYLYEKINSSIIQAADRKGFELVTLEGRRNRGDEQRLVSQFIGMQVDGLVITSNQWVPGDVMEQLHRQQIPVVAIERDYALDYVDNLLVKDYDGMFEAVSRAVRKGHRRIGMIAMKPDLQVEKDRLQGYLDAVTAGGADPDPGLLAVTEDYSQESGFAAMEKILNADEQPTVIFTAADTLAAGAMQLLYKRGIRIPDQMSIAGYDNVLASLLAPQIDSVDLAVEDIGDMVVELIRNRMQTPERPSQTRYISTKYIDRETVRRLEE